MDKEKNEKSYHKININWYPGHMAKTKKQILEDLKLIKDASVQVSHYNENEEDDILMIDLVRGAGARR